jgi:hypothetical protein
MRFNVCEARNEKHNVEIETRKTSHHAFFFRSSPVSKPIFSNPFSTIWF